MSISSNQQTKQEEKQEVKQDPQISKRAEAIQKMVDKSTKFNEDAKQVVTLSPNVPEVLLFPSDFWLDYQDLVDEAVKVNGKTTQEAAEYAEKNFRVKRSLETDPEDASRTYAQHVYKVRLPNSTFPAMVRDFKISSKTGIEKINEALQKVALQHDGPILMRIIKKQKGNNKFKVDWEIDAKPAPAQGL